MDLLRDKPKSAQDVKLVNRACTARSFVSSSRSIRQKHSSLMLKVGSGFGTNVRVVEPKSLRSEMVLAFLIDFERSAGGSTGDRE